MSQNQTKSDLLRLEKLIKRVIRKSLKDNTLDYTVQFTVSNLEPEHVKYAAMISSPAKGVQPITFIFDNLKDLEGSLKEAETGINRKEVEKTFHQSRINTYENKVEQHKARLDQLNDPEYDEDAEIEMEEVGVEDEAQVS